MPNTNTVLLLTACINPQGMSKTALQDKDRRLAQYKLALDWYLHNTDIKIVFIENTNFDISPDYTNFIEQGRLEILTFNGNNYDKKLGKGFGEALIIKYGFKNSRLLNEAKDIVKVTGRLIIKNTIQLLNHSKPGIVYCNLVKASSRENTGYSIFFKAPKSFYTGYFLKDIQMINDETLYYFEHYLNDCCNAWEKDGGKWKEFWLPILICGQSGTSGTEYKTSYLMYVKQYARYIMHKCGIYKF